MLQLNGAGKGKGTEGKGGEDAGKEVEIVLLYE